jgi:putative colanic acid biosynthesis UDP-glucose lipid carrier transferase
LQWQDDDNILSEQENSFYLSLGKRVIDIIITLGVIIFVLSWLFPIISLFVFLDSRGPIFFLQPRTGFKGTSFYCIKFRTMYNKKQTEFKQTSRQSFSLDARIFFQTITTMIKGDKNAW